MLIAKLHAVTDFPQPAVGDVTAKICQPLSSMACSTWVRSMSKDRPLSCNGLWATILVDSRCAGFSLTSRKSVRAWTTDDGKGANGSEEFSCEAAASLVRARSSAWRIGSNEALPSSAKQTDTRFCDDQVKLRHHEICKNQNSDKCKCSGDNQKLLAALDLELFTPGDDVGDLHDQLTIHNAINIGGSPDRGVEKLQKNGQPSPSRERKKKAHGQELRAIGFDWLLWNRRLLKHLEFL